MNNIYEDSIFNLFTESEESFEALTKIAGHLPAVKVRLLNDFWEEVKKQLEETVKGNGWKCEFKDFNKMSKNRILLYKQEWKKEIYGKPLLGFIIERLRENKEMQNPYYGPFTETTETSANSLQVQSHLKEQYPKQEWEDDETEHNPVWRHLDVSIFDIQNFPGMLPTARKENVEKVVELVWRMAQIFESDLDYCHQHFIIGIS